MSAVFEGAVNLPSMTEDEFVRWCDEDTRAEYVDGKVVLMSPVSTKHYEINKFLLKLVDLYLEQRPGGRLLGPECMVRLRAGLRRVPDLLYVAPEHADRVRDTILEGAPDVAWEIISPDSERRDWQEKVPEYQEAGIREYWIVNPYVKTVWLLRLNPEGRYESVEAVDGKLTSSVIPGFWLRPDWLWSDPQPRIWDCLRELEALPEA
ncbi:MAG: Uma2 family endonuclease [Actinomycetota bacterium]